MAKLTEIWDIITRKEPNRFDEYLFKLLASNAIYPDQSMDSYLAAYTDNNDVFTIINKITEPGSGVPIFQYDANGEKVKNGRMISRLNKPNSYQSRSQFIEATLTFYYLFGNCFIAQESLDTGLNAGMPARLDCLPPQWMQIHLGSYFTPVSGYSFYPFASTSAIAYTPDKMFHWKEFNPDYSSSGGHLRGMSRLQPLLKSVTGSTEAYNSLVKAFQAQGMWGLLTMLDEDGKSKTLNAEQKSELKNKFRRDSKKGDLTILNSKAEYTKMGLTIVELEILKALGMFKGNLADAFNVPNQLLSGSQDRTYNNFKEADRSLWTKAICPSVDALLEGLSGWLAPKFNEDGDVLKADYSGVEALQTDVVAVVTAMVAAQSFTKNEIRIACKHPPLDFPGMDEPMVSIGMTLVSQVGNMPNEVLVESAMKELGLTDYRQK